MSEDTQELRTAAAQLDDLVRSIGPEDWGRSTPCDDWTVADLVAHVVHSTDRFATTVSGGEVDWTAPTPAVPQDAAAAGEAFRASADRLLAAWDDAGDQPMGPAWQVAELGAHTYDLATALGRGTGGLDPSVADTARAFMEANLTDDRRGDVFGPRREAPAGADAYQRLAAYAGREV